jgi:hypothetical protein
MHSKERVGHARYLWRRRFRRFTFALAYAKKFSKRKEHAASKVEHLNHLVYILVFPFLQKKTIV